MKKQFLFLSFRCFRCCRTGVYLTIVMSLTSMSVVMSVIVTNVYERNKNCLGAEQRLPQMMRRIFIDILAKFFRMQEDANKMLKSLIELAKNETLKEASSSWLNDDTKDPFSFCTENSVQVIAKGILECSRLSASAARQQRNHVAVKSSSSSAAAAHRRCDIVVDTSPSLASACVWHKTTTTTTDNKKSAASKKDLQKKQKSKKNKSKTDAMMTAASQWFDLDDDYDKENNDGDDDEYDDATEGGRHMPALLSARRQEMANRARKHQEQQQQQQGEKLMHDHVRMGSPMLIWTKRDEHAFHDLSIKRQQQQQHQQHKMGSTCRAVDEHYDYDNCVGGGCGGDVLARDVDEDARRQLSLRTNRRLEANRWRYSVSRNGSVTSTVSGELGLGQEQLSLYYSYEWCLAALVLVRMKLN